MYYCENCDNTFESSPGNEVICPYCGSGETEEMQKCNICEEYFKEDDLYDTDGYVNGGCGYCCEQCIKDGDMVGIL